MDEPITSGWWVRVILLIAFVLFMIWWLSSCGPAPEGGVLVGITDCTWESMPSPDPSIRVYSCRDWSGDIVGFMAASHNGISISCR